MAKHFLTYHAGEHDPKHTQVADLKFEDDVEVEVPAAREWLWWRLHTNPNFSARVEEEKPPEQQRNEDDADALNYGEDVLGLEPPHPRSRKTGRYTKHRN